MPTLTLTDFDGASSPPSPSIQVATAFVAESVPARTTVTTALPSAVPHSRSRSSPRAAGDVRVPLYDIVRHKKLSGFASPMYKNLSKYLERHPNCILYDKERVAELRKEMLAKGEMIAEDEAADANDSDANVDEYAEDNADDVPMLLKPQSQPSTPSHATPPRSRPIPAPVNIRSTAAASSPHSFALSSSASSPGSRMSLEFESLALSRASPAQSPSSRARPSQSRRSRSKLASPTVSGTAIPVGTLSTSVPTRSYNIDPSQFVTARVVQTVPSDVKPTIHKATVVTAVPAAIARATSIPAKLSVKTEAIAIPLQAQSPAHAALMSHSLSSPTAAGPVRNKRSTAQRAHPYQMNNNYAQTITHSLPEDHLTFASTAATTNYEHSECDDHSPTSSSSLSSIHSYTNASRPPAPNSRGVIPHRTQSQPNSLSVAVRFEHRAPLQHSAAAVHHSQSHTHLAPNHHYPPTHSHVHVHAQTRNHSHRGVLHRVPNDPASPPHAYAPLPVYSSSHPSQTEYNGSESYDETASQSTSGSEGSNKGVNAHINYQAECTCGRDHTPRHSSSHVDMSPTLSSSSSFGPYPYNASTSASSPSPVPPPLGYNYYNSSPSTYETATSEFDPFESMGGDERYYHRRDYKAPMPLRTPTPIQVPMPPPSHHHYSNSHMYRAPSPEQQHFRQQNELDSQPFPKHEPLDYYPMSPPPQLYSQTPVSSSSPSVAPHADHYSEYHEETANQSALQSKHYAHYQQPQHYQQHLHHPYSQQHDTHYRSEAPPQSPIISPVLSSYAPPRGRYMTPEAPPMSISPSQFLATNNPIHNALNAENNDYSVHFSMQMEL